MVKVLFTQTRVVQDGTGTTFTAGEVYDLPVSSAERWKRRGVAVDAPPFMLAQPSEAESETLVTLVESAVEADWHPWEPAESPPTEFTITGKASWSGVTSDSEEVEAVTTDAPRKRGRPPKAR